MNKTAIKNFAIWARNKLIADITYKAGLLGISEKGIKNPLPQSTSGVQFFDIGTKEPYSISGIEIRQREALAIVIRSKEQQSDYVTAYKSVVEEVAYTWFNRLIAVRFMEVNDYLPSNIRVLSSENVGKDEPDLVTNPFDADLEFTPYEKDRIMQLKQDNKLDELFRMLFVKQCNALNSILPNLFEQTSDYTELILNVAFTDKDGVVYRLVHDISEDDFNVSKEGQVEIIGWLYQYYNTEPKDETFALLKKNVKITKERIPPATQLFTPDWIVRYMVENSLGRLWLDGHPNDALKSEWKYYLDEAEQEEDVQKQLAVIREEYRSMKPEDIKVIDSCMGSGHILVYAFDVLMQIYESYGYSKRDAAKSIIESNIYGLDIDNRAYQLAYFAVMMKGRQYNRRILNSEINSHLYAIKESNGIKWSFESENWSKHVKEILHYVINVFKNAKEYGSILDIEQRDYQSALLALNEFERNCELTLENHIKLQQLPLLRGLVLQAGVMAQKYDVVVTNPPYMGSKGMDAKLSDYVQKNYPDSKSDLFAVFIERCGQLLKSSGYQAMITQHAWMFLSSYEKLRGKLMQHDIVNMAHLGARAFEEIGGEVVQTTSFVLANKHIQDYKAVYNRLTEPNTQQGKENLFLKGDSRFITSLNSFDSIPGSPIAYWLSDLLLKAFANSLKVSDFGDPKVGLQTGNNERYYREWYEIDINKVSFRNSSIGKFVPCIKGGENRKWYGNQTTVIDWENNGASVKQEKGSVIRNPQYYYKSGLEWTKITSNFALRYFSEGFILTDASVFVFPKQDNLYVLSCLNSKVMPICIGAINPTLNFVASTVAALPISLPSDITIKEKVNETTLANIEIAQKDWNSFEISWDFLVHPMVFVADITALRDHNKTTLAEAYAKWDQISTDLFFQLKANEEELNRIFIDIYDLQDELTSEVEDKDVTVRRADLGRDIRSFISYAVGCMFGRYSLDKEGLVFAGGDFSDYFRKYKGQAALDKDGNPIKGNYAGISFAAFHYSDIKIDGEWKKATYEPDVDNIILITDEEYFEDNVVGLFIAFVKKAYGAETLEENLDFIAKALGNKGNTSREIIRNYFLKDFFNDHCKVYQKRPIYWLFDSGKVDGFKALIYMHRYDENTIGNIRIDYLHKMQRVYDREIIRMQETIDNGTNAREVAAAEKRKEKLTKQLKETKDYDEKIAHLALARIAIDLDDGVKVNYEKVQTGTDGKKLEVLAKI